MNASRNACACAMLAPGFRRPTMMSALFSRPRSVSAEASPCDIAVDGIQRSDESTVAPVNPRAPTPTTVKLSPFKVID